jgi:hypothetical protein
LGICERIAEDDLGGLDIVVKTILEEDDDADAKPCLMRVLVVAMLVDFQILVLLDAD